MVTLYITGQSRTWIFSKRDKQNLYNIVLSLFSWSPVSPEDLAVSGYSPQGEIDIIFLLGILPEVESRGRRDESWRIDKKNYSFTRCRATFSEKRAVSNIWKTWLQMPQVPPELVGFTECQVPFLARQSPTGSSWLRLFLLGRQKSAMLRGWSHRLVMKCLANERWVGLGTKIIARYCCIWGHLSSAVHLPETSHFSWMLLKLLLSLHDICMLYGINASCYLR